MISNDAVSPNADERISKANFNMYNKEGELIASFPHNKILSASLVQECYINQSGIPQSEFTVVIDNSDMLFDVTDKNNVCYSLDEFCPMELFFSCTAYGGADVFMKKARMFFADCGNDRNEFSLKATDVLSKGSFSSVSRTMADLYYDYPIGDGVKPRTLLEDGMDLSKYKEPVHVPDDINNIRTFKESAFVKGENEKMLKEGFYIIAAALKTQDGSPVRLLITEDGTLTLKARRTDPCDIIPRGNYIDYEIITNNGALAIKVRDRGNILRQLGDVVVIQDYSRFYKAEIYKQTYTYQSGILSAEWEALLL